jgi:hypothetical protein
MVAPNKVTPGAAIKWPRTMSPLSRLEWYIEKFAPKVTTLATDIIELPNKNYVYAALSPTKSSRVRLTLSEIERIARFVCKTAHATARDYKRRGGVIAKGRKPRAEVSA